jgi:hypothetical protein
MEFVFAENLVLNGKSLKVCSQTHRELQALIRNAHFQFPIATNGKPEDPAELAMRLLKAIDGPPASEDATQVPQTAAITIAAPDSVRKLDAVLADPSFQPSLKAVCVFNSMTASVAVQFQSPLAMAFVGITDAWMAGPTTPRTVIALHLAMFRNVGRGSFQHNV